LDNTKEKRSLGRCRHTSKYNISIDFNATGWKCVDWISLAWDETMNIRILKNAGNFLLVEGHLVLRRESSPWN